MKMETPKSGTPSLTLKAGEVGPSVNPPTEESSLPLDHHAGQRKPWVSAGHLRPAAAHELFRDAYSPRTAPRFPLPRNEAAGFPGLPTVGEMSHEAVSADISNEEEERYVLSSRVEDYEQSIHELFREWPSLEDIPILGIPATQAVAQVTARVRELVQRPIQVDEPELNQTIKTDLADEAQTLKNILNILQLKALAQEQKQKPAVLRDIQETTGGRSLVDYTDGELVHLWKLASHDRGQQLDMIERQLELWEQFLEVIEDTGEWEVFENILQKQVEGKALALEHTNVGVREQLDRIRAGELIEREENWLIDHYLGYHELLVAAEKFLKEWRAQRKELLLEKRAARESRQAKRRES